MSDFVNSSLSDSKDSNPPENSDNITTMKLWINLYGEDDNTTLGHLDVQSCPDGELQELRVVVLLVIGVVGALIVGSLLCCMLYKNERILQTIPCTKEYKRRKDEPEYFYPIPKLGAIKVVATQGKSVAFLSHPDLMEGGLLQGDKTKGLKLSQIAKATDQKDPNALKVDDGQEGAKSDASSFYESDGLDDADNTFGAGGERQMKNKKKHRKHGDKRIKRLRKKNQYSTTVFTKGATPTTQDEPYEGHDGEVDVMQPAISYMSRF